MASVSNSVMRTDILKPFDIDFKPLINSIPYRIPYDQKYMHIASWSKTSPRISYDHLNIYAQITILPIHPYSINLSLSLSSNH